MPTAARPQVASAEVRAGVCHSQERGRVIKWPHYLLFAVCRATADATYCQAAMPVMEFTRGLMALCHILLFITAIPTSAGEGIAATVSVVVS